MNKIQVLAELAKELKEAMEKEVSINKEYHTMHIYSWEQQGFTNGILRAIEIINKLEEVE